MNTLKEDKNEYEDENERIKVYLKIKPSFTSDKILMKKKKYLIQIQRKKEKKRKKKKKKRSQKN